MKAERWAYYQNLLEIGETYYLTYKNAWIQQCPNKTHYSKHSESGIQEYIGTLIDITEEYLVFNYKRKFHYQRLTTIQRVKFMPKPKILK